MASNREVLVEFVGLEGAGGISKALTDVGLVDSEQYLAESDLLIQKAAIDPLLGFYEKSKTEGDVSVTYNTEAIRARLLMLANKFGRTDVLDIISPQPKIKSRSLW